MGRHKAVWSNHPRKIDLAGTPDRFQALPGVEIGLQGPLMTPFEVLIMLIVWSDIIFSYFRYIFISSKPLILTRRRYPGFFIRPHPDVIRWPRQLWEAWDLGDL